MNGLMNGGILGKRLALSVSSWFCIPEQGMKDLEILCRASAMIVKSKTPSFGPKYHVVTVSHTIAPWRWPKLFPDEWLQFVNEKHTYYTVELRQDDGTFLSQSELQPIAFHHKSRDLAVLHLDKESEMSPYLADLGIDMDLNLSNIDLFSSPSYKTQNFMVHGHDLSEPSASNKKKKGGRKVEEDEVDDRVPIPKTAKANLMLKTDHQSFLKTSPVLAFGMCGGPITYLKPTTPVYTTFRNHNKNTTKTSTIMNSDLQKTIPNINNTVFDVVNEKTSPATKKRSAVSVEQLLQHQISNKTVEGEAVVDENNRERIEVFGMIEGIVPPNFEGSEELHGCASYIESTVINEFLNEIETGVTHPIIGGDVIKTVGSDQDPKKMDYEKLA